MTALSNEAIRLEEQLHSAEAELAEQQARVRQVDGVIPGPPSDTSKKGIPRALPVDSGSDATNLSVDPKAKQEPPTEVIEQYQSLVSRLPQLRQAKQELLN